MNVRMVVLVVAVLCLAAIGAGFATPSLVGTTGLAVHPTAEVIPTGTADVAVDFQDTRDFFGEMWLNRAVIGAGKNLEVDFSYNNANGETKYDVGKLWTAGVKYIVLDRPQDNLKVAVGTGYLKFDEWWNVKGLGGYVVATKVFCPTCTDTRKAPIKVKGHLGVFYGTFEEHEPGYDFEGKIFKPWVGVELVHPAGTTLALEYRFRTASFEEHAISGAVLRQPIGERLQAEIGTTNIFSDGAKQAVFYGLSYRLGNEKTK
jgi:hypothetical protein